MLVWYRYKTIKIKKYTCKGRLSENGGHKFMIFSTNFNIEKWEVTAFLQL